MPIHLYFQFLSRIHSCSAKVDFCPVSQYFHASSHIGILYSCCAFCFTCPKSYLSDPASSTPLLSLQSRCVAFFAINHIFRDSSKSLVVILAGPRKINQLLRSVIQSFTLISSLISLLCMWFLN